MPDEIPPFIVSRGTQLVARYIAMALVASGTLAAAKAQPYAALSPNMRSPRCSSCLTILSIPSGVLNWLPAFRRS